MDLFKIGELINYCITRKSSYAIKDAIDSILSGDRELDYRMLRGIMEEIEIQYPDIIGVLDLYKKEIGVFSEKQFDFKNPTLEYTYSYILYLEEGLLNSKHVGNELPRSFFSHENTFYSTQSQEALMYIAQQLINKKFIKKLPLEYFVYAFQEKPIEGITTKIEWLKSYNDHQNDNIGIAMLLYKLCPEESAKDFKCVVVKLNRLLKNKKPWNEKIRGFETSLKKVKDDYIPQNVDGRTLQDILES